MRHVRSALVAAAVLAAAGVAEAQEQAPPEQVPQEQMAAADSLDVVRAVIATGVQDREPVGIDTTFAPAVGTVYFSTVVEGDFGEAEVHHVWLREGEEIARVPLTVRGPRWRTWSSKTILPEWTGRWTVKVVGPGGTEHASVDFTITG